MDALERLGSRSGHRQTLCPASGEDYKQELYRRIGQYLQGQRHFPQNATPELWDLYDKDRQPLGRTIQRGQPMQEGEYHLGVTVAVFNTKGEILSTRRAPGKALLVSGSFLQAAFRQGSLLFLPPVESSGRKPGFLPLRMN